jgi:hypothetical protein
LVEIYLYSVKVTAYLPDLLSPDLWPRENIKYIIFARDFWLAIQKRLFNKLVHCVNLSIERKGQSFENRWYIMSKD